MTKETVQLKDIPDALLPFIKDQDGAHVYCNGGRVKSIFKMRDTYRIYIDKQSIEGGSGEYRYKNANIEIF